MTMCRRVWLLSLAVLFSIQIPAFSQYDLEDDLRRADKQFELYAYNLALQSYLSVHEKAPNNAHALTRIADCYFQLNRPEDALVWYDRATNSNNAQPEVLLQYGKALMATGNYPAAKKWFIFYGQHNAGEGKHFAEMCEYATFNANKEALYAATNEPTNSPASDFGAAFWGKKVVMNSARTDLAKRSKGTSTSDWAGTAYNQLLVSQADAKGNLTKPAFLKSDLANNFNEGPVSFSADGRRVAFCKNNFVDGTRQIANSGLNMNIFIADVQSNGEWANAKAFTYNSSEHSNGYPFLSADGNTLLFASNRPGGEGGWDLYQSVWNGKSWSQPQNLGDKVNTPGNEITPFRQADNLFFSSDWHLGFGGMDVFRSELKDGVWDKIFHLGPGINSSRDDYGFIFNPSENIGYLTSNRSGGKGNEDIWRIQKRTDDFEILVLNDRKEPIEGANIDFTACGGKTFKTDKNGKYAFSVGYGKADCEASISKEGFRIGEIELKSKGAKQITLVLEPDGIGRFIGQVLDFASKKPLSDVQVRALPMPKGDVVVASTGADGTYKIALESKKTYKISYSKEGYADAMISLETGNAKATNEVSAIYLQGPANTELTANTEKSPAVVTYSTPTTTKPEAKLETKAETKTPELADAKTTVKDKSAAIPPASNGKTAKTAENPVLADLKSAPLKTINGFAVQIASTPGAVSTNNLARYDQMRQYGNIYTRSAGNVSKVRVGVYATRAEAMEVQKKALALNYKGAFVLAENNIEESLVFSLPKSKVTPAATTPTLTTTPAATPAVATPAKTPTAANNAEQPTEKMPTLVKPSEDLVKKPTRFAVQLASLANDQTINLAPYMKITDLGNIYTRSENDLTKIRLGVWENADAAKKAQESVVKRGFKDAVVILETSIASTDKFLIKTTESTAKAPNTTTPKGISTSIPSAKEVAPKPVESSTKPTIAAPATPQNSPYKVRVATFQNAQNFDESKLRGISGKIEYFKEGKNTVVLIGGYPDLATAEQARTFVQTVGYRDAFVVEEKGGKLIRLRK